MVTIRRFELEDIHQCIDVFMRAFAQDPWNEQWTYSFAQKYLRDSIDSPGFVGIVALNGDNEVCGMLFGNRKQWWDGEELHIAEMCVMPSEQGKGIGTQMLEYVQ